MAMNKSLTPEQEKELQEILNLAKIAEDKLKQASDFATKMVEKHSFTLINK
jgi:hypothetical protein